MVIPLIARGLRILWDIIFILTRFYVFLIFYVFILLSSIYFHFLYLKGTFIYLWANKLFSFHAYDSYFNSVSYKTHFLTSLNIRNRSQGCRNLLRENDISFFHLLPESLLSYFSVFYVCWLYKRGSSQGSPWYIFMQSPPFHQHSEDGMREMLMWEKPATRGWRDDLALKSNCCFQKTRV